MIPKEMARNLFNKFYNTSIHSNSVDVRRIVAKEHSIQCVKEILSACNRVYDSDMVHFRETAMGEWWLKVVFEIEEM